MEDRRSERCQEFAPPSMYFNAGISHQVTTSFRPATETFDGGEQSISYGNGFVSNPVLEPQAPKEEAVPKPEVEHRHESLSEIPLPDSDSENVWTEDKPAYKQNPMAELEQAHFAELSGKSVQLVTEKLVSEGLSEIRAEANSQVVSEAWQKPFGSYNPDAIPSQSLQSHADSNVINPYIILRATYSISLSTCCY